MLFSSSKNVKNVVPTVFASFYKLEMTIGMPKMPCNARITRVQADELDSVQNSVARLLTEQIFIDVLFGIAELNKIGIQKDDNRDANVLLDSYGTAYIADFSTSKLVEPVLTSYKNNKDGQLLYEDLADLSRFIWHLKSFFENRKVKLKLDWKKIEKELSAPIEVAKTTVKLAELFKEGLFKK